ncbi:PDZ domain-containing protein [Xanthomonas melonis]|nr:type II secretion system protein N [Xanthomonas melonis]MCD0280973.1 PDZ domain-containing protein [Xanthomonas melonis]
MSLRVARTVGLGVLAVLLVVQALRLVWLVVTPIGPLGTRQPVIDANAEVSALRRDVFYRTVDDARSDGIMLHGVRAGGDHAAAYLSDGDGGQGAYRVGDAVLPGVVVQAIAADHVLLRAGSGVRRLVLADAAPQAPAPPAAGTRTAGAAAAVSNAASASEATAAAAVDPQQLLSTAGLRASQDGSGLTVMPRGDGALLRQAGLAPGDVLTQINGRTLDAEHLRELQDELRDGQAATLTYRRNGQTHTMTLKRPQ